MSGAIPTWPKEERPREKLLSRGAEALTPSELLAALLRTGEGRGRTALDLARELWLAYGEDWGRLAQAAPGELTATSGIGPAKAASIAAALEIGRRAAALPLEEGERITGARSVYEHFRGRVGDLRREAFFALLLDARGRLLREEEIGVGTLTSCLVHPREAFRAAVRESAASVVFVHNHPSGDPTPSRADVELTRRLLDAAKVLEIKMADHVIVAAKGYYSFMESRQGSQGSSNL